jgi:hypothetical protein
LRPRRIAFCSADIAKLDTTALYARVATMTIRALASLLRDCTAATSPSFVRWDTRLRTSWKT